MGWCLPMKEKFMDSQAEPTKIIMITIVLIVLTVASATALLLSLAPSLFWSRRSGAIDRGKEKEEEEEKTESEFEFEIDCVVCLNRVGSGDKRRLLPCNHGFHHHCINSWLQVHSTCPLCRSPVPGSVSSSHRREQHQIQLEIFSFYDGLVYCLRSPLESLCRLMAGPENSELMLMAALYNPALAT